MGSKTFENFADFIYVWPLDAADVGDGITTKFQLEAGVSLKRFISARMTGP